MLNARSFLAVEPRKRDYKALPQEIRKDPQAWRRDFAAIAIDSTQRFDWRVRALLILSKNCDDLHARGCVEIVADLNAAFEQQFPGPSLERLSRSIHSGDCTGEAYLAYCFCIALATLDSKRTSEAVNAILRALDGSEFGAIVRQHLELIDPQ